ncbi:MAG: acetolactate synthase [Leptospiraceae bacterium]|nr:MAG: acetolactate synthase [Leptospiraceae bacterium]
MKKSGAYLVTYALEQIGVQYTFGIPGVHVTELYDELNKSEKIQPILVTHEGWGAFMADAISRTTNSIGTLVIVPAAGMTHALSGIGEAYLDGIPMLIISGGIRRDLDKAFQLHQLDQGKVLEGIVKKYFLIEKHEEIIPTIYEAYKIAKSGKPGPVFIEVPVNIQLFEGPVSHLPEWKDDYLKYSLPQKSYRDIEEALALIESSQKMGIFAGWGAIHATDELIELAERLQAPVCTTLQGLSVFPYDHPLHTGMGFGPYSVPAAEEAFKNIELLIAIGTSFGEIPTGSFGMKVPSKLIHIDINPEVFNKNYQASVSIEGDAKEILKILVQKLKIKREPDISLHNLIKEKKEQYRKEWIEYNSKDKVNPGIFFTTLRNLLERNAFILADDGNHTFLTEELMPIYEPKTFLSPTDFNCMGYCVPACIGVKLTHPDRQVIGIVGDGAFLMSGLELLTASTLNLGVIIFLFHDGELSQISQGQEIPYNRKTCTILGEIHPEGIAKATGSYYLAMNHNNEVESVIKDALEISKKGQPVIVDVKIDYSKRTRFTQGVVKINLARFPLGEKFRFIGRALLRRITG